MRYTKILIWSLRSILWLGFCILRFVLFCDNDLVKTISLKPWQSTHRVPDLQLDLLPLDVDHASTELDADGEIVHRLEPLVRELEQQARLAHPWAMLRFRKTSFIWVRPTCVPDDDVLEQVAVGHGDCSDRRGGRTSALGASLGEQLLSVCHSGGRRMRGTNYRKNRLLPRTSRLSSEAQVYTTTQRNRRCNSIPVSKDLAIARRTKQW